MALRVWLPLNGNLENKGNSNLSFATQGSNLSITSDGKLGKTYTKSASSGGIVSDNQIYLGKHLTMCAWVNVKEFNSSSNLTGVLGQHRYSTKSGLSINLKYKSSTTGYICCSTGDGSNRTYETYYGTTVLNTDEWYHLCLTYDGAKIKLYVNGNLDKEVSYTAQYNISDYVYLYAWTLNGTTGNTLFDNSSNYNFTGRLNDVRFYDECLSPKQIKEISKGLITHYKLDTPGSINNLRRGYAYGTYNNYSSSGSTCTVVDTGTYYNGSRIFRMTYIPNETSLTSVQTTLHSHGVTVSGMSYLANTKYCYWTLCKPISHPDTVVGGTAANIGGWTEIPMKEYGGGWYIVGEKRDGTFAETKSDTIFTSFKTPSATSGTPIIIDFCCPHLVEGYDEILPEFDYHGTVITQETDVSGYGYNGAISGTLTFNTDSPRYSGSTIFDTGYFKGTNFPLNVNSDAFTISCWFKPTRSVNMAILNDRVTTGDGLSLFFMSDNQFRFDTGSSYQWVVGTGVLNKWHHVVVTWDKNTETKEFYLNGVLVDSTSNYGTLANLGNTFTIGRSNYNGNIQDNQIYGSMSDFRIYATALSANDIKELYQTAAFIDNKNDVYAYEFKEE